MKRTALLRRTPIRRGRRRLGQAARERVRAGGKLALGRDSLPLEAWRRLVADLTERAGWRCEDPGCRARAPLDPDHVVRRSASGPDHPENIVMVCRRTHNDRDRPFRDGRLVVSALGGERFLFAVEWRAHKGAPLRRQEVRAYARPGAVAT